MCSSSRAAWVLCGLLALAAMPLQAQGRYPGVGRAATADEVRAWDIDVRPDFKGLPSGAGSVAKGQQVWDAKCASCHGVFGESNEVFTPVVGGTTKEDIRRGRVEALVKRPELQRTTLMKMSSIATLWDYINRAMPWNASKTLSVEEVYAVTAYILNLGEIVADDFVLSDRTMPEVQKLVPNRDGMTRDHGLWDVKGRPDVRATRCMKDCLPGVRIASSIPEYARDAHGNLAEQNRVVGPVRGVVTVASAAAAPVTGAPAPDNRQLAQKNNCLACHGVELPIVGPAFRDIATRYRGDAAAQARLAAKVRSGGGGVWGNVPMPPNPAVEQREAESLVRWILAGAAPG